LTEKGKAYYKKAGFDKFLPSYNKEVEKKKPYDPEIKLPPLGMPEIRMKETIVDDVHVPTPEIKSSIQKP